MTDELTDLYARAFFLADHAIIESGKVYASGAFWDRLRFPGFPAVVSFGVVAVLNVPWRAHHQPHSFRIWFEDADGGQMAAELGGDFQVGSPPEMRVGEASVIPLAATVGNFTLPRAGGYSAVLSVDGSELARWPFRATQVLGGPTLGGSGRPSEPQHPPQD